jgi:hypothetical protein
VGKRLSPCFLLIGAKSLCHCKITPSAAVADEMPVTVECRSELAVATAVTSLITERLCCRGCTAPKKLRRSSCIGWLLHVQRLRTAGYAANRLANLQRDWCGDERQLHGYWETELLYGEVCRFTEKCAHWRRHLPSLSGAHFRRSLLAQLGCVRRG